MDNTEKKEVKTTKSKKKTEKLTIEDGFAQLSDIIDKMDMPNVSLETSFELYNDGVKLVKELGEKLSDVEAKLNIISE